MGIYLNIIQIIISIALIGLCVMQGKTSGMGRMFGGDSSFYRTRRGAEKTFFNLTIILSVVFFITAVLNVIFQG